MYRLFCVTIILLITATGVSAAHFSLDDLDVAAYGKQYNSLPGPDAQDAALKESGTFEPFMKEARSVVDRYDLGSHVGMRLTHRHFSVKDGHIMAEEYGTYDERPSLITSSQALREAMGKRMIPASWILSRAEAPQMFEASNDEAVYEGSKLIQRSPEFLDAMAKLLDSHKLDSLLSVALLSRHSLASRGQQFYGEISFTMEASRQESVVQLWDEGTDRFKDSILTSWPLGVPREHKCTTTTWTRCDRERDGCHWPRTIRSHIKT